jgi:SpoVK/Ycf46/Vps4 family AAA+-type ATPase
VSKYRFKTDIADFTQFANKTDGFTGAEIETVLRKAYEIACDERRDNASEEAVILERHLTRAIERCHPNTGFIEMMTKLAIEECDDEDLLISADEGGGSV